MIPAGVDLSDLSAQLSQGNVAIGEHAEFARAQQSQLRQAIAEINSNSAELASQDTENTDTLTGDGKFGIALIDTPYDKAVPMTAAITTANTSHEGLGDESASM